MGGLDLMLETAGSLHWPLEKREIRISALCDISQRPQALGSQIIYQSSCRDIAQTYITNKVPELSVLRSPDTALLSETLPIPQLSSLPRWYFPLVLAFVEENEVVRLQMFIHRLSRFARAAVQFGGLS